MTQVLACQPLINTLVLIKFVCLWLVDLPLSTIFPNKFFPLKKFLVEQFHLLYLNWCWHSATAMLAPLATAASTPGFSRANLRCLRLRVACTAGSIYSTPGDSGDKLFGSPAFAIPLWTTTRILLKSKEKRWTKFCHRCERQGLSEPKNKSNKSGTPLKAMGATRNEMLIWKGKDNKQLTTELSIRRRLDKYLRRALILEGRASKHARERSRSRPVDSASGLLDLRLRPYKKLRALCFSGRSVLDRWKSYYFSICLSL